MIGRAVDGWMTWPVWAKWASAITALMVLDAGSMAWGERDFVSGFFEAFIAVILQWGGIAASFGGAFWAGTSVFRRTERHLLAWPAGILIFAAVALSFQEIGASIPGVGWRLEAMQDSSCYTDWDGRSNPTVCE